MLSSVLAQQIAAETTEAIGHNVIITDVEGMVIGSGDQRRIGSLHEASLDVVRSQESAWHSPEQARALSGVRPGITLPLVVDGEAVGTVGITGSPRQVRRFGLLVRRQTEILLQEADLVRGKMAHERALENLVTEIATYRPDTSDRGLLDAAAAELGFNLAQPRVPILLEVQGTVGPELLRAVRTVFHHHEDIVATRSTTQCLVLAHDPPPLGSAHAAAARVVESVLGQFGLQIRAGVGEAADSVSGLHHACQDAADALTLGARVSPGASVLRIGDLRVQQALASIPPQGRQRLRTSTLAGIETARDGAGLRATVMAWCESGFNLVNAADTLHIHRNTLLYRLEKIERILDRPWRDHRTMLALYFACLADQVEDR